MKLVDSNRRPLDPKFDVVPLSHRFSYKRLWKSLSEKENRTSHDDDCAYIAKSLFLNIIAI